MNIRTEKIYPDSSVELNSCMTSNAAYNNFDFCFNSVYNEF